jgi:hypothetical protein
VEKQLLEAYFSLILRTLNLSKMKKVLTLFLFVFFCGACVYAQNAQVTFGSTTNFSIVEDGFHPVKFQLTEGSNANVEGLLQYVQKNPKYFKVQVDGNELTLNFVEGVHWGVWMKVFGAMEVSQIEIREANQNLVVAPMDFLRYFHLINQ